MDPNGKLELKFTVDADNFEEFWFFVAISLGILVSLRTFAA